MHVVFLMFVFIALKNHFVLSHIFVELHELEGLMLSLSWKGFGDAILFLKSTLGKNTRIKLYFKYELSAFLCGRTQLVGLVLICCFVPAVFRTDEVPCFSK